MTLLSMHYLGIYPGCHFAFVKAKFKLKTHYTNILYTHRVSWPKTKLFSLLRNYVLVKIDKPLVFHIPFPVRSFNVAKF